MYWVICIVKVRFMLISLLFFQNKADKGTIFLGFGGLLIDLLENCDFNVKG